MNWHGPSDPVPDDLFDPPDQTAGFIESVRAQTEGYFSQVIWPSNEDPIAMPLGSSVFRDAPVFVRGEPMTPETLVRVAELPSDRGELPTPLKRKNTPRSKKPQAAYSEAPSDNISVNTPERELELIRAFAPIGLDPCSNPTSTTGARVEYWGPRPTCATCGALATHGVFSSQRAERCAVHRDDRRDDDGMRVILSHIPPHVISDPRYGRDGLALDWKGVLLPGEIVFLQPPYGRYIAPWVPKANREAEAGAEILGLLPGRYDTAWFNAMRPTLVCWYARRIPYVDHSKPAQKDSAKFPSAFVYWGPRPGRFSDLFAKHGKITTWR